MALRTVWVAQPRFLAMDDGRCPRPEASKIWQRRKVKASHERNPSEIFACSSGLTVRTKRGAFMCRFFFFAGSPPVFQEDDQNEPGAINRSFVAPGWLVAMGVNLNSRLLRFTNGDDS